jgi:hypothetical protein
LARALNSAFSASSGRAEVNELKIRCKKLVIDRLSGKGQQLGLEAQRLIYDSFIESNEHLRKKFFPEIEVIFPPPGQEASPDYLIAEDDFGTITDVLDIIRKQGMGVISMQEYTNICTAIFSSIDDVTKLGTEDALVGTKVVLTERDAVLLSRAARHLEVRDNNAATRLMTLASQAAPSLLLPRAKLQQYRASMGKQAQEQYMLMFYRNNEFSHPNETKIFSRFLEWLGAQEYAAGNFLVGVTTTSTILSEGMAVEPNKSEFDGYTIVHASSIDAAVSLAKECPLLELGWGVQVLELNFEFPPRIKHHVNRVNV